MRHIAMAVAPAFRIRKIGLLFVTALVAPATLSAQVVTTVRVAQSGTQDKATYRDATCTAESKRFSPQKDKAATDTLRLRVQDDRSMAVKAHVALIVRKDGQSDPLITIPTDSTQFTLQATKKGEYLGALLTVIRDSDKLPICTVLLRPPVEAVAEDTSRRAFRVGIGASFDFLSGISSTDLYYDVTAYVPRIWDSKGTYSRGIDMGLYNGRTVSRRDTIPSSARIIYFARSQPDSVQQIRQQGTTRRESTEDRLGVYAAHTVRLAPSLSFALHVELIKRSFIYKSVITIKSTDTSIVVRPNAPPSFIVPAGTFLPDSVSVRRETEFQQFFGTGPIVQYMHPGTNIELRLKPMLGFTIVNGRRTRQYVVQGRITDFENGLKLGAEVRGDNGFGSPLLLVFLAKDFGLKRLADFVVGGDDDGRD